jgi:hypothetical protein
MSSSINPLAAEAAPTPLRGDSSCRLGVLPSSSCERPCPDSFSTRIQQVYRRILWLNSVGLQIRPNWIITLSLALRHSQGMAQGNPRWLPQIPMTGRRHKPWLLVGIGAASWRPATPGVSEPYRTAFGLGRAKCGFVICCPWPSASRWCSDGQHRLGPGPGILKGQRHLPLPSLRRRSPRRAPGRRAGAEDSDHCSLERRRSHIAIP